MNAGVVFPHFPIPQHLAYEFLGTFARCEYALKATRYARGGRGNSVEANWDAFAQDMNWHFARIKDRGFVQAVTFYLNEPPRKQVLLGGRVQFRNAPVDPNLSKAEKVLLLVRRVRNNLFHGAKVWSVEYTNRQRDICLLQSGLVILRHAIHIDQEVGIAYEHGAF